MVFGIVFLGGEFLAVFFEHLLFMLVILWYFSRSAVFLGGVLELKGLRKGVVLTVFVCFFASLCSGYVMFSVLLVFAVFCCGVFQVVFFASDV